jgi:hypothetical protein
MCKKNILTFEEATYSPRALLPCSTCKVSLSFAYFIKVLYARPYIYRKAKAVTVNTTRDLLLMTPLVSKFAHVPWLFLGHTVYIIFIASFLVAAWQSVVICQDVVLTLLHNLHGLQ